MPEKKKPEAAAEAPALVFLKLEQPINGLVAGRIVTASETKAASMVENGEAVHANPDMLKISGTSVPHLPD